MLFGLEAAGGAAVTGQGLDCMVQCALDLGMELRMLQLFTGNPFGGGDQRGLTFQMLDVPGTGLFVIAGTTGRQR